MVVQNYAILDGSDVVNIILLDEGDSYIPPAGHTLLPAPDNVAIGWQWVSDTWISPVEPPVEQQPAEDPEVVAENQSALEELMEIGVSEATARRILGLL